MRNRQFLFIGGALVFLLAVAGTSYLWLRSRADVVVFSQELFMGVRDHSGIVTDTLVGFGALPADYRTLLHTKRFMSIWATGKVKNRGNRNAHLVKIQPDFAGLSLRPLPSGLKSIERNTWYSWIGRRGAFSLATGEVSDYDFIVAMGIFDEAPTWESNPSLSRIKMRVVSFENEP